MLDPGYGSWVFGLFPSELSTSNENRCPIMSDPIYDAKTGNLVINGVEWESRIDYGTIGEIVPDTTEKPPLAESQRICVKFQKKNCPNCRIMAKTKLRTHKWINYLDPAIAIYYTNKMIFQNERDEVFVISKELPSEELVFDKGGQICRPSKIENRLITVDLPGMKLQETELPEGVDMWDLSNCDDVYLLPGINKSENQ